MNCRMLIGASVLTIALALGTAGSVGAKGKPGGSPPDLSLICTTFPLSPASPVQDDIEDAQAMACDLLYMTDGERLDGCGGDDATGDNGFVDYFGRNCDRNEETLLGKVAGIVIKLEDILTVAPGKVDKTARKVADVVTVLCAYEAKVSDLATEPKLRLIEADGVDLAMDAQDIRYLLPGITDCE